VDIMFPANYNQVGASANVTVSTNSVCGAVSATRTKNVISIVPSTPSNITTSSGSSTGYCNSPGVFSVTAVPGVVYTWSWPAGVTPNSPNGNSSMSLQFPGSFVSGIVSVTAKAASCPGESTPRTISVTGAPASTGPVNVVNPPCNFGLGTFNTTASNGATTYLWTVPANGTTIDAQSDLPPNPGIDVTWGNGAGQVTVKAVNSCGQSQPKFINYTPPCRIADDPGSVSESISVYPNPAKDKATLTFSANESGQYLIRLMDVTGREAAVFFTSVEAGVHSIEMDLTTLAKGVYSLELRSHSGSRNTRISVQ